MKNKMEWDFLFYFCPHMNDLVQLLLYILAKTRSRVWTAWRSGYRLSWRCHCEQILRLEGVVTRRDNAERSVGSEQAHGLVR
jgi:hypothetical protein